MRTITVNNRLSKEVADRLEIRTAELRRGQMEQGNCFHDALEVCSWLGQGAYYVEGIAKSIVAVEHAWVYFKGEYVDVTWYGLDLEDREYYPLIVTSLKRIVETGGYVPPIMRSPKLKKMGIDYKPIANKTQWIYKKIYDL